jgi:hypothetical protein
MAAVADDELAAVDDELGVKIALAAADDDGEACDAAADDDNSSIAVADAADDAVVCWTCCWLCAQLQLFANLQ